MAGFPTFGPQPGPQSVVQPGAVDTALGQVDNANATGGISFLLNALQGMGGQTPAPAPVQFQQVNPLQNILEPPKKAQSLGDILFKQTNRGTR